CAEVGSFRKWVFGFGGSTDFGLLLQHRDLEACARQQACGNESVVPGSNDRDVGSHGGIVYGKEPARGRSMLRRSASIPLIIVRQRTMINGILEPSRMNTL